MAMFTLPGWSDWTQKSNLFKVGLVSLRGHFSPSWPDRVQPLSCFLTLLLNMMNRLTHNFTLLREKKLNNWLNYARTLTTNTSCAVWNYGKTLSAGNRSREGSCRVPIILHLTVYMTSAYQLLLLGTAAWRRSHTGRRWWRRGPGYTPRSSKLHRAAGSSRRSSKATAQNYPWSGTRCRSSPT